MSLLSPNPKAMDRFDRLAKAVTSRGKGITLAELRDCHALARELELPDPDPERVGFLSRRLNLDPNAVT